MPMFGLQAVLLCFFGVTPAMWAEMHVNFDAATASSTYSSGSFSADEALARGSGYWCSSGNHMIGQSVTWTGILNVRHKVIGVRLNWAYGPGEFKVLSSGDGGNFEEAASWRSATRSEVSYVETVMFDHTLNVKALSLVMKAPMQWGYFGLNDVSLLVEPYPFMILSGATSPTGERCVTATDVGLSTEDCLDAIAAGDGREVFRRAGDQIVHTVSHRCVTLTDSNARRVGLQDCETATRAQDGRSDWILTSAAQLKMLHVGNYCLTLNGGLASAEDCGDASMKGEAADQYFLAAVPELDLGVAASVKNGASLLAAATSRQRKNLAGLQAVLPSLEMCKFSSFATNVTLGWNTKAFPSAKVKLTTRMRSGVTDMAMMAISKIYPSIGADMADTMQVIRESSATLLAAEGKLLGKVS